MSLFRGPWILEDDGDRFLGKDRKPQRGSVTFLKTGIFDHTAVEKN
jgi:hypothetical protein